MTQPGAVTGRTVLVTGGTGGIGKATAVGLAGLGARVAITGRVRRPAADVLQALPGLELTGIPAGASPRKDDA